MQFSGVVDDSLPAMRIKTAFSSGVDGRHIYFRYKATSGDIVGNTIEQLDLENMDTAVGILLLCALELEI